MRFLGYRHDGQYCIGVVANDEVTRLTTIEEFYSDPPRWLAAPASGPSSPLAGIEQVPPVPTTSKILCLGLNLPGPYRGDRPGEAIGPQHLRPLVFRAVMRQRRGASASTAIPTASPS